MTLPDGRPSNEDDAAAAADNEANDHAAESPLIAPPVPESADPAHETVVAATATAAAAAAADDDDDAGVAGMDEAKSLIHATSKDKASAGGRGTVKFASSGEDHDKRNARMDDDDDDEPAENEGIVEKHEGHHYHDGSRHHGLRGFFQDALSRSMRFDPVDQTTSFPMDAFTLIFFANMNTFSFINGIVVFLTQMFILILLCSDMLGDDLPDGKQDDNRLNIPPAVDDEVLVAQGIALFIAILSNTDVTTSLTMMSIGYHSSLVDKFPSATFTKFVVTVGLHMLLGVCTLGTTFILIVQSLTVLDIFLNFAALTFIEQLDDWVSNLASEGWFGMNAMMFAEEVQAVTVPYNPIRHKLFMYIKPSFVAFVQCILFATFFTVVRRQGDGTILQRTSCGLIEVNFGDEVYPLAPFGFTFKTEMVNETRRLPGSDRILGKNFNETDPPDLHYAYFSGNYHIRFSAGEADRPAYFERDSDDLTSGMFYYCDSEAAWVFTIRSLIPTGAIPTSTLDRCSHGWLLRSPHTEAFTLDEAPQENWQVWTGVLGFVRDDDGAFRFFCAECETDMDCGLSARGSCQSEACVCEPAVAEGNFCEYDRSCDYLVVFFGGDYTTQGQLFGPYTNFRRAFGNGARVYGRSVYFLGKEILMYTGRRWYDVIYEDEYPFRSVEDFERLHAFWDSILLGSTWWFSDPTEDSVPTGGGVTWRQIPANSSIGSYGAFGFTFPVNQRFECLEVNCNISHVCGTGYCNRTAVLYEQSAETEVPTFAPTLAARLRALQSFDESPSPSLAPSFTRHSHSDDLLSQRTSTPFATGGELEMNAQQQVTISPSQRTGQNESSSSSSSPFSPGPRGTQSPTASPTVTQPPSLLPSASQVPSFSPSEYVPKLSEGIQIVGGKCECGPNQHGWYCEFQGPDPLAPTDGNSTSGGGLDGGLDTDNESKGEAPTTAAPTASSQPSASSPPSVSPTVTSAPSLRPTVSHEPSVSLQPTGSDPPSPSPTTTAAPTDPLII